MNNKEVCKFVKEIGENTKTEYISELCVKEGYGQLCGGYLASSNEKMSQKDHFLYYYGSKAKEEKMPSYNRLRCPQLLLFIAEIAGVPRENVVCAYEALKEYENSNKLKNNKEKKDGNYLWGEQILKDFKEKLCIREVVEIIKNSKNWSEVINKTNNLRVCTCQNNRNISA